MKLKDTIYYNADCLTYNKKAEPMGSAFKILLSENYFLIFILKFTNCMLDLGTLLFTLYL